MKEFAFQLLLQFVLIALNAVFASAEIAIISMNDAKLHAMAVKGDKRAKRLVRITASPAKFLATIQVAITLSGFLGSAFAADNFSQRLVDWLMKMGVPETSRGIVQSVSVIVVTLILSYFTLVFGELVPKRIAMKKAESMALGISGLISGISVIFKPVVWFLSLSTNGVLRLCGIDPNDQEEVVTEEEIRMMVDAGSEKGTIDEEEKELITNVFAFDDRTADEIATHRTHISFLWTEDSDEVWEKTIHATRHTYYPVCRDSADNIIGILNAKDYFRLTDKSRKNIMQNAVKEAFFVPETVTADVLFRNMKARRSYFAVVLDEYGGVSGIVTMTDILESIVGDFDEENIPVSGSEPPIHRQNENTWSIAGAVPLEEAEAELGIKADCEDCDTFGGYVLSLLGVIPEDGSAPETDTDALHIKVIRVKDHRICKTVVTKKTVMTENK